ncbi:hypothetical protein ACOTJR_27960 [Achromobacter xylosoxidans]
MRPELAFKMVLSRTRRADLAVAALGYAARGAVNYDELIQSALRHLCPPLAKPIERPARMIDGAQAAGLMHALLTGRRPRPWSHLDADELETMLALHRDARGYVLPHKMDNAQLLEKLR